MRRFDSTMEKAMDLAYSEAMQRKHTSLTAAHLFWGILSNPKSLFRSELKNYKKLTENILDQQAKASGNTKIEELRPSPDLNKWLTLASSSAIREDRDEISEHDLLQCINQVLPQLEIPANIAQANHQDDGVPAEELSFLINLKDLAQKGKIDPVIGRTKEIRAVMEILGRRNKNNPILVGPAGVGKTAIVEGLALAINKGQVPDVLQGKTIYNLDLGALTAGTKFRGEFEERIQKMIKFIKDQKGQAILFIDEIHQLVGAGRTDGAMDAANLLKPALARGELSCIGATTEAEFQKYILGDAALERRFRAVPVNEPSLQDAVEILMGVKEKLEIHHGIKIADQAVWAAVELSNQYIQDKQLPDKAIDLLDEAASALKLSAEAMPASLAALQAEIRTKKIYAESREDKAKLHEEIQGLQEQFDKGYSQWQDEVLAIKAMSDLKNQIERLRFQLEQHEMAGDYEKASEIKYATLPRLEQELAKLAVDAELGRKDIAQVIARQTSIPLEKILKSQQDHILALEDTLNKEVFGQKSALHEISETLIASHAGLADDTRPLGSFLLLGPSGVGKTETAKSLARFLYQSERSMIRFDLSEFSEKHAVAKLIGAPAGYVGYDEGGQLTEAIRKHPYSVILFDEVEKAHPDFADILLQILDDGRLTDNKGRLVNFKNTIIFMTSNSTDIERDFKPELLGRFDAILRYEPLGDEAARDIIEKTLRQLNQRLEDRGITISLSDSTYSMLAAQGFSPQYGARPLNVLFNQRIVRPLAKKLLQGEAISGRLVAHWQDHGIEFTKE